MKVWDAQAVQKPLTLKGGGATSIASLAFSPDGKRLASGSAGYYAQKEDFYGEVRVWDSQTGKELLAVKGVNEWDIRVAFSPDGKRLASASKDQSVKVWDAETGKKLLTLAHSGQVRGMAYSPDGKRLASASDDTTLKVWNAQTGEELLTLRGGAISAVFSPDGHWLASGAADGTVTIWDATPLPEKR